MVEVNVGSPFWLLDQQRKFWQFAVEQTRPLPPPKWTTPNTIELELKNVFLRNFTNENSSSDFPVLILPPQAGHHSSIADYDHGQSLVEAALNEHASVYATEWPGATCERRNETIDDFIVATNNCVDTVLTQTGADSLTLVGLCQGGWQSAIYAALYPEEVNHLVLAAAPIDFLAGNGKIQTYAESLPLAFYEYLVALGGGNMPGEFMLTSFKMLNACDRYIKDPLDVFEHIDDERYMQRYRKFRNWYEWTQDLPGGFYLQAVRELFKENRLIKGELEILGQRVDPSRITCPLTLIAGDKDDITVPPQLFNAEHYFGSKDIVKMMAPAGHVGVFMAGEVVKKFWPRIFKRARISSAASQKTFFLGELPDKDHLSSEEVPAVIAALEASGKTPHAAAATIIKETPLEKPGRYSSVMYPLLPFAITYGFCTGVALGVRDILTREVAKQAA